MLKMDCKSREYRKVWVLEKKGGVIKRLMEPGRDKVWLMKDYLRDLMSDRIRDEDMMGFVLMVPKPFGVMRL